MAKDNGVKADSGKLSSFRPATRNANRHTGRGLKLLGDAMNEVGYVAPITVAADGETIDGSARLETAFEKFGDQAIVIHHDGTKPVVMVRDDIPNAETPAAKKIAYGANRIGQLDLEWEPLQLAADLEAGLDLSGLFDPDELSAILEKAGTELLGGLGVSKDAKPKARKLPLDLVFTLENYTSQWVPMAYYSGWKWGIQSNDKCLLPSFNPHYDVTFVDNVYTEYKHKQHLAVVKRFSPKYCTTRDLMTRVQCQEVGIEYYSLGQVLDQAEELAQYAQNVIIIPKYDCLDKIPEKFMLGYSVPTSHGGTPLPVAAFKGRRVHLLGGSWKAQLAHLAELGDDVVSIDNNYVLKQSEFGNFDYGDGTVGHLQNGLGLNVINGMTVALAISFGAIAAKINELYPTKSPPSNFKAVAVYPPYQNKEFNQCSGQSFTSRLFYWQTTRRNGLYPCRSLGCWQ